MSKDKLKSDLNRFFKKDQFESKVQEDAVREIIKREKDVFISMPPGSGKSLCFQLPGVLQKNKITVVFSPLLDLINKQLDYLNNLNIKAVSINSTMSRYEQNAVMTEITTTNSNIKFLYLTPHQAAKPELFEHMAKYNQLAYVVVEEAHCISKKSHHFLPEYMYLTDLRRYPNVPWIALTATASPGVVNDIINELSLEEPVTFKIPCFRDNIFYDVIYKTSIDNDYQYQHLKRFIEDVKEKSKTPGWPCGIIYCRTIDYVYIVANSLTELGIKTVGYHSEVEDRIRIQEEWMSGDNPIICATFKSLMGVDKTSVRFVCHWDVPQSLAGYYQESGKAGRDGEQSFCRLYLCSDEFDWNRDLLEKNILRASEDKVESVEANFNNFLKIMYYCTLSQCRHKFIAEFFGDNPPNCTGLCDLCKHPEKIQLGNISFANKNKIENRLMDLMMKLEELKMYYDTENNNSSLLNNDSKSDNR